MNKITMKDIAALAGVSKATVSMVMSKKDASISEVTKNRIFQIAKELNYIPNHIARSLSTKKSGAIAVVLTDNTNPFFSEMIRSIEDEAHRSGYNLVICNTDNDIDKEQKYMEILISKLIDGIIFICGDKSNKGIITLKNNNIPFVLVDRYIEGYEEEHGIFCLNKQGSKDAIKYLYEKGNRRIVFVSGSEDLEVSNQRLEGYIEAMKGYGLYDKRNVFDGDFNIEGGLLATEKIINTYKSLDAIFYSNDLMALGGIKMLHRKGYKIPRDLSIIGFDNIHISKIIEPELTTMGQPIYEMGKKSCNLLISVINGDLPNKKQIYFNAELIIRGTT